MSIKTSRKQHLVNPSKWIGKYVRHLANWRDFQFGDIYSVCEWTGKLMLTKDDAYYGDYFETKQEAESAGYDECYYYSEEGLLDMHRQSMKKAA